MTEPQKGDPVPAGLGQLQIMASLPPLKDTLAGVADISVVNLGDLPAGILDPFALVESDPCATVRDLFAGTPEAGAVIQFCELEHHTDNWAHRMTNPDGSVTTWRS